MFALRSEPVTEPLASPPQEWSPWHVSHVKEVEENSSRLAGLGERCLQCNASFQGKSTGSSSYFYTVFILTVRYSGLYSAVIAGSSLGHS